MKFARTNTLVYNHIWLSGSNSVVECDLAKVEVAGSNPVSRSIWLCEPSFGGLVAFLRAYLRRTQKPRGAGANG